MEDKQLPRRFTEVVHPGPPLCLGSSRVSIVVSASRQGLHEYLKPLPEPQSVAEYVTVP